jgi:hypothetical protein
VADYISLPVETDPDELAEIAFDYLRGAIPGWDAAEGNIETWLVRACARIIAEARDVAADVPPSIMRWFGTSLMRLPPLPARTATATSTWTLADEVGYTIPAGTPVLLRTSGNDGVVFNVLAPVVVPAGNRTTALGEVQLVAEEPGALPDGLTAATPVELIQSLEFVDRVELTVAPAGGADAEDDDAYLDRLASHLELLSPAPIVPRDFEVLALSVPGVRRALALDGYDKDTGRYGNARTITLVVCGPGGATVGSTTTSELTRLFARSREVNWKISLAAPVVRAVDAHFEATVWPGYQPAEVMRAAQARLELFLSPDTWGSPPTGERQRWIDEPRVRYLAVAQVLQQTEGLRALTLLRIARQETPLATSDVVLEGPGTLTRPGVITYQAIDA